MRVLLLITTHLSLEHITFLRKCWPPATHKERECARWRADHKVVPDYSWGTLPVHLQKRYKAYDCDSLVPPVPDALPTGPTETVRRGWNRTAGSRYQFAADGITFESSGGI